MHSNPKAAELALQAILANSLVSMDKATAAALAGGTADILLEDHGMDSLAKLELSIFLGEALSAEVSEGDLQGIFTFGDLVSFLSERFGL